MLWIGWREKQSNHTNWQTFAWRLECSDQVCVSLLVVEACESVHWFLGCLSPWSSPHGKVVQQTHLHLQDPWKQTQLASEHTETEFCFDNFNWREKKKWTKIVTYMRTLCLPMTKETLRLHGFTKLDQLLSMVMYSPFLAKKRIEEWSNGWPAHCKTVGGERKEKKAI